MIRRSRSLASAATVRCSGGCSTSVASLWRTSDEVPRPSGRSGKSSSCPRPPSPRRRDWRCCSRSLAEATMPSRSCVGWSRSMRAQAPMPKRSGHCDFWAIPKPLRDSWESLCASGHKVPSCESSCSRRQGSRSRLWPGVEARCASDAANEQRPWTRPVKLLVHGPDGFFVRPSSRVRFWSSW